MQYDKDLNDQIKDQPTNKKLSLFDQRMSSMKISSKEEEAKVLLSSSDQCSEDENKITEICLQKHLEVKPLQIVELSPRCMLYLHGDFVLCFSQFQNENISRKFHHNNVFRSVRQVNLWKSHLTSEEQDLNVFVEAKVEKSFFSKKDYLGVAQNLVFHGRSSSENIFGEALLRWYQRGSAMISLIQSQNIRESLNGLVEQEALYNQELMRLIYAGIEQEKSKNDFLQYNIIELNRNTQQFETTYVGISSSLSFLLGAEATVAVNIIMRNGILEYLDNRTVMKMLCKQFSQNDLDTFQSPTSPPKSFDYYQVLTENDALIHTLDDISVPCKIMQYTLRIDHNLRQKYPLVALAWEELRCSQISLPFPDYSQVQMRIIDIDVYAIQQLIEFRQTNQINVQKNMDDLGDEIGYSIRSMFFMEKFYARALEKKKRIRRKKGHINDWDYLRHKYEQNNQIKNNNESSESLH